MEVADERVTCPPDFDGAATASVAKAVGRDLIGRQNEVGDPPFPQPRLHSALAEEVANPTKVRRAEDKLLGMPGWPRQLAGEGFPAVDGELGRAAPSGENRMVVLRRRQHFVVEAGAVVGAQKRPGRGVGKSQVEQRLVAAALVELSRRAARPDRFADPAHASVLAVVLAEEVAPSHDDPGRVAAELFHIHELDLSDLAVEVAANEIEVCFRHRDEDRLPGLEALAKEGHGSSQQLIAVAVEQRLMAKAIRVPGRAAHSFKSRRLQRRSTRYVFRSIERPPSEASRSAWSTSVRRACWSMNSS